MKVKRPVIQTVTATAIRCIVPLNEEELADLGADYPGVVGDRVVLVFDLDTKCGYGRPGSTICLRPRDSGTYELLGADGEVLATRQDYVPVCLPGRYGDYIDASFGPNGEVTGPHGRPWRPTSAQVTDAFM